MNDYPIPTNDVVVGDEITFTKNVYIGAYPRSKFSHYEQVQGTVIHESYGNVRQQHTFTIQRPDGTKFQIKGRNLYRNRVYRKYWQDEDARKDVAKEKHERGAEARKLRYNL